MFRKYRNLTVLLGLGLATVACERLQNLSGFSKARHIFMGGTSAAATWDKKIFMVAASTNTADMAGTATNVRYQRCFVTARHVLEHANADKIYSGVNPATSTKSQHIERKVLRDGTAGAPTHYTDIGVFWVSRYSGSSRIADADYSPRNVGKASDFPVPLPIPFPTAEFHGYGEDPSATPSTAGTRRMGVNQIVWFSQGTTAIGGPWLGSFFKGDVLPGGPPIAPQQSCGGDSGGPLFKSGSNVVYGVTVKGWDPCDGTAGTDTYFTAFDEATVDEDDISNWVWLNRAIQRTCTKSLSLPPLDNGKVQGNINIPQTWVDPELQYTEAFPFDNDINCGTGGEYDCIEEIHEDQNITITATPDDGYQFSHWSHDPGQSVETCPCVGEGASCFVTYNDIGYYYEDEDEFINVDDSVCVAHFEPIP